MSSSVGSAKEKTPGSGDTEPYALRWRALALLALAQFVVVLDASVVNIALPSIGAGLGMSAAGLSWVVNAYVISFGGLLLLGGRLADLFERRVVFVVGLLAFGAASLAGGLAPSAEVLIGSRVVQGAAAAVLSPVALSLVATLFTDEGERRRAFGVWGAVAGSGGAVGVLLGGVLTGAFGWPWVFLINVPVVLLAVLFVPRLLPAFRDTREERSLDLPGAFLVTAGLFAVVYALIGATGTGWASPRTVAAFALGLAMLAAFVFVEGRVGASLVPLHVFTLRGVRSANAVMLFAGAAMTGLFFFLSLYMQQVLGYGALTAGLTQLPLVAALIGAASVTPFIVARLGTKPVLVAGLALFAAGLAAFGRVAVDGSFLTDILGPSLLVGGGLGLAFVTLTDVAVGGVPDGYSGLASGMINTALQIGGAVGLAVLTTVATGRTSSLLSSEPGLEALTGGFQWAFLAGAALVALAVVIALLVVPGKQPGEGPNGPPDLHLSTDASAR